MTDKPKNSTKYLILLPFIGILLVYLVWFRILYQRQISSNQDISALSEKLEKLEKRLGSLVPDTPVKQFEHFDVLEPAQHFIDTPSRFPRIISNGVFPTENSESISNDFGGRRSGDMEKVAVLIESTNRNDTERLVSSIISQRLSSKDLDIFLYTPTNKSGVELDLLKTWTNPDQRVFMVYNPKLFEARYNVYYRHKKDFVIYITDYKHIGDDFADFFFIGKVAMEEDKNIKRVCGGSNGVWQDRDLGDVLWLSDTSCHDGEMTSRRVFESHDSSQPLLTLRPEMARVGNSTRSVTAESSWNIDKFDARLITKSLFEFRLEKDLERAVKKSMKEWDNLKTFNCLNAIYTFPYESEEDLEMYFPYTNVGNLYKYREVLSISIQNCRVYIVPKFFYDTDSFMS